MGTKIAREITGDYERRDAASGPSVTASVTRVTRYDFECGSPRVKQAIRDVIAERKVVDLQRRK